jgi:predicted solute-binding protein
MRLVIHDTLVTAPLVAPLTAGWIEPAAGVAVELKRDVTAADVGDADVALLPASELSHLQASHQGVPDVAVISEGIGAVSLRTPVRPDEIEQTPVKLMGTTGVGELLARATLHAYFGIQATAWIGAHDERSADAEAVVFEGTDALRPIEGGFAEDLCRAWFILTGLPVVSHVLAAPLAATRAGLQPVLDTFRVTAAVAHERRREWREDLIARHELDRDRVLALLAGQRYELLPADRQALAALFQRGGRGSTYPTVAGLSYLEAEPDNG